MFYAKSTGGFYATEIHSDNIPADAVEIPIAQHAALLAAQSSGKVIQSDKDGYPVALDPAPLPIAEIIDSAKKQVRKMRSGVFYTLAGMQSEALANEDSATAKAIAGIQVKLRALPDIDLSECKTEGDVNEAFAAAWMTIVASAPANVALAFNEVFS